MKQTFNFTINPKIKEQAQIILESQGMKMSSVIELYLKKIIGEYRQKEHSADASNSA